MKKIIVSLISISLLISPTVSEAWQKKGQQPSRAIKTTSHDLEDNETITSLWDIVKLHVIKYPDNVNRQSLIISGATILTGLITYYGTSTILKVPVLGNLVRTITTDLVTPEDLIQGLSLVVGISGTLGLYENSPELRKKFIGSFTSILLAKQVAKPGRVEAGEVWTSALQSFALLHLLGSAEELVTPVVEKCIQRAVRRIQNEDLALASHYDY